MKYLLLLITASLLGCSWINRVQSVYSSSDEAPVSSKACSSECRKDCEEIFPNPGDFNQCIKLGDKTVYLIQKAVDSMRRGIWNPITEEQITFLTSVSYTPWIKYADTHQESAGNMLIWLAENEQIPRYLDDKGEVLKAVLDSLSSMSFNKGIKDALSKDIEDGRTFLELLAWRENTEGFIKTHRVILEVCGQEEICIRQAYCQNNSGIVSDTVNKLGLNSDFQDFDFTCS